MSHAWYMVPDGSKSRFYDFIRITGESNNPIFNVGIEDLKIDRCDYNYMVNPPLTEYYEGMSVRFNYSKDCWISGVEFYNAARNHIYITNSNNLEFRGCYFHHAISYGGGGRGYGIQIGEYSNKCLVENNVLSTLRHAIVLSDEAHHNVIAYNSMNDQIAHDMAITYYVTPDICIHGQNDNFPGIGPYENLVEGNCCSWIRIDKVHSWNGQNNFIFRNRSNEYGFEISSGNMEQIAVNNYFEYEFDAQSYIAGLTTLILSLIGFTDPLIFPYNEQNNADNFIENNKCKDPDDNTWWVHNHNEDFYNDYSYYCNENPDFIIESFWPFDPVNQINPAEERWNSGETKTELAGWDHYYFDLPEFQIFNVYFYRYENPVTYPPENYNEISIYYHGVNIHNPVVTLTIEKENGEYILDNQVVTLTYSNWNGNSIPFGKFYKRLLLDDNYTGPLTIKIYEDGVLTKETTVEYSSSNKPPIPKLYSYTSEPKGIYPVNQSNAYCSQLYYNHLYTLKFNAPYQGDIYTWYKIMIEWDEDDGEHTYPLNNTSYTQFNDNGTVDLHIPPKDEIIGSGVTAGNVRLKINDVEGWYNHPIVCTSDAFNGLITTISYPGIIWYLIKQYTPGTGCPSIYINNKYCNNILPLAENQKKDQFDYILLDKSIINPGKSDFQIKEDQNNRNYLDMVQLVGVGHSKEVEIGVNNKNGYIFPYSTKSQIRFDNGKDSIFILQAEDSLLINLSDLNIPPVEYVYLKVTCSLLQNKVSANPNKEKFSIGEQASKDTTENVIDIVGLHETVFTSYSEINENDIDLSNGILSIKSSRDIEISEISVVLDNSGKDDFEISNCNILKATSIQDNINVLDNIRFDDDEHFIFGLNDGVNLVFENPILNNEKVDYVFISKGRYNHIEEEVINSLEILHYPNPFSTSATISFSLPMNVEKAQLKIYNLKGQLVKIFNLESEDYSIIWDGKDSNGLQVANGIYFYKLTCNNRSVVKKMIFLR